MTTATQLPPADSLTPAQQTINAILSLTHNVRRYKTSYCAIWKVCQLCGDRIEARTYHIAAPSNYGADERERYHTPCFRDAINTE